MSFDDAVVDGRVELDKLDGVMDERKETTATAAARTITSDDIVVGEGWITRVCPQLGLLYARYEDVVQGEMMAELGHRIADAVAIPADYPIGE